MNKFGRTDPHAVSIPSADITSMEVDRRCHIYINGRELPECETYGWFEAAIHEKAARERLDENGLARCGCGGVAEQMDFHAAFFPHSKVECLECGIEIMRTGYTIAEAHDMAKMGWNTSRGYTAPHLPGAIGPDAGEMAPNGEEGATHE